jgi:RNA polymerase-associated protein LEO1
MASPTSEDPADLFGEEEDDLFGDEEQDAREPRVLDDEELDSGDDEDRNDGVNENGPGRSQQADLEGRDARVMDASFPRQAIPAPTDGQASLIRVHDL